MPKVRPEWRPAANTVRRVAYDGVIDLHIREHLESLAERLHLHEGPERERADELHGQVTEALETDDHTGLMDTLEQQAVAFEDAHPDLAAVIRKASDVLSASGI